MPQIVPGLSYFPAHLSRFEQDSLYRAVEHILHDAPPFRPTMPRTGQPFSVRMSNCGPLGWVSDLTGYRYQTHHPVTEEAWPPMPPDLLDLWTALSGVPYPPEACLINLYEGNARMGLHQDRDEQDFAAPVLSVSLGDTAVFRIGGTTRQAPTTSFKLTSGDVMLLGGPARLAFHGVDRVIPGSSSVVPGGGRINLTMRRVTPP